MASATEGLAAEPVMSTLPERRRPWVVDGFAYALAIGYVLVAAAVAETLYRLFGLTRLSPVFLAPVLVTAVTLGMRPAFVSAALAFSIYNVYLVEPRFSFTLDSPEEILTLLLFLAVALMTGGLAGRVRDEAVRSHARARTMAALFEASRELSSTDEEDTLRQQLAQQIAAAARGEAEVEYQGRTWRASFGPTRLEALSWTARPLAADGLDLGIARWRSAELAGRGAEEINALVQVLVDLGAAAVARTRLAFDKAQVETLARTERLRTALLSSVSHDFRTPLTGILTSVTSLREFGGQFEPSVRDDLLCTIQEEAERLNGYVANLLNFTKLESGALEVAQGRVWVPELLGRLLKRQQPRTGARVFELKLHDPALEALGDAFLLEQALSNVLENAIRYGPPASTITIRAAREDGRIVLEITDEGPGVAAGDEERIFEKFYRSSNTAAVTQGTGLGLSIARGMVEAMGGTVNASRRNDGVSGLRMTISLPAAPR